MVSAAEISWGSYADHEGPWWRGSSNVVLPENPTWPDRVLMVVCSTEGGCWDSLNAYDRAIMSVGAIQWIELGQLSVSDMLGVVCDADESLLVPLTPALYASNASFGRRSDGKFRFRQHGAWVESAAQLRELYLGGSTGLKGQWTGQQKNVARLWASGLANVFQQPLAQIAQRDYTCPRLETFAFQPAKRILWDGTGTDHMGVRGGVRSGYLSFAANNPTIAAKSLGALQTAHQKWSVGWGRDVLKTLATAPKIAIYPGRLAKILPTIKRVFDVDLS